MSELRPAGVSAWKTGLIPRTVHVELVVERVVVPQKSQSHKHGVSPKDRKTKKSFSVFFSLFQSITVTKAHHPSKYRPSYMGIGVGKKKPW
jgi:hypothetical protein